MVLAVITARYEKSTRNDMEKQGSNTGNLTSVKIHEFLFSGQKITKSRHQTGADVRRCSGKKLFLKISQNLPENICAVASFLAKLQTL